MTCPDCETRRARVFCDPCSLKGRHCSCGNPATQWLHVDRFIMQPCCDEESCLPYVVTEDGRTYWKVRE